MKSAWLVCFDIENDRVRHRIGRELLRYGWRVQHSVFEIAVDSQPELKRLQSRLRRILDGETELRFYRLCLDCRRASRRIDGAALAEFPVVVII